MRFEPFLKSCYQHILRRQKSATIFFIFAAFFVVFFHKGLITGTFYALGDPFVELHPLRRVAWDMIRHGSLPLWTPYIFSGYPLLSMAQNGLGYPLTWGYLFLPSQWAEQINVLAPFLLAPIFTYLYVRALGKSRLAGVLAGLCFGYGGFMASRMSNGLMPNAVMWLPLILIPILKVSNSRFIPCLLGASVAYLMSVLNGTGQGFVWVGITAMAYGFYLSAVETVSVYRSSDDRHPWKLLMCWKPLAVAGGAVILAAGLASFQIFESWAAKSLSIRNVLGVERFNDLTYSPTHAWRAFLAPLYNCIESTPFVAPGAAILALGGVIIALRALIRNKHLFLMRDPHLSFWFIAAIVSGLLILGTHTPLYGLIRYIPIVNAFRGPSRLSFIWSLALSVLAAYGLDALALYVKPKKENARVDKTLITSVAVLILTIIVGCLWVNNTPIRHVHTDGDVPILEDYYLKWKAAFTCLSLIGLWFSLRIAPPKLRTIGLCAWIAVACFFEPYVGQVRWWGKYTLTADRMTRISPTQKWLQQYPPEENRVYTRVKLLHMEVNPEPLDVDSPNQTVTAGLHNVAGYEPLILQRYSRALGDVGMDGVSKRGTFEPSDAPLDGKSHVLDLLNTRFLVVYSTLSIERETLVERKGIGFGLKNLPGDLLNEGELNFDGKNFSGDTLAIVTTLVNSAGINDRTAIARAEIQTTDGQIITRDILAGIDTSEWAYDRDDVRPVIRHARAPIFDSSWGDEENSFYAHRYMAAIPLEKEYVINRVSIKQVPNTAPLKVWKVSLHNSRTKKSIALNTEDLPDMTGQPDTENRPEKTDKIKEILSTERWKEAHRTSDTIVFRNERALPRAWLVGEVKFVDAEEAFKTITGESDGDFDPRRTALIEADVKSSYLLSHISGGEMSPNAVAKISSYEPNRLKIDTEAEHPSFLVLSEVNYPGWNAQVDGVDTPIYQTDYLLRGVALPAGKHTIVMEYKAPAFWKGVYVSGLTFFIVVALALYGYVGAKLRAPVYRLILKPCYQLAIHILNILQHHKNATTFFIFAAFFVVFFHKGLITGTFYTIGDQFAELHPLRRAAWDMIRQGSLPLWTPYIFSGYPLLSMAQNGLGYPLTWGYLFLPSQWAEQINVLAPFLLAPIFTYLYVRALGKSRLAGILAGLCFGYGGFMASWMTNGLMPSAVMWLPLVLIPILKVSERRFIPCLIWACGAYLMSVLNGTGQGFVWVGITALAYGFYLSAAETLSVYRSSDDRRPWDLLRRWKPLAVAGGAVTLAAGLASFQIFETWSAKTLSIRNALEIERFNELAFSPAHAWKAFLAPLYNYFESTPFIPLGAAVLAMFGVIAALRKPARDKHLFFWFIAAITSGLLILGSHTPLYGLLRHIPIVNAFRGPSRHSFEWTFALSVLAAYGWDAVTSYVKPRRENVRINTELITSIAILILTIIVGCLWVKGAPIRNVYTDGDVSIPESRYLMWKAAFTSLSLIGLWFSLRVTPLKHRTIGLCAWIAVACFFEPYICQARWWGKYTLTADRMTRISPTQRWLQQYPPEENRVYTRVRLLETEMNPEPLDIDSPNHTVIAGLQNVAGYEPLMLQRYSRALGDAWLDGISKRDTLTANDAPLDRKSHVLDLLNTRFLVTYSTLFTERDLMLERKGIGFRHQDLPCDLLKEGELKFDDVDFKGDTLALVTTLVDSVGIEDRIVVANAEIHTTDGRMIVTDILAGFDTSEWAYDRNDVRQVIRHARAPIFDSFPNDEGNFFRAHRYIAIIPLGGEYAINRVSIKKIPNTASLKVWKASIHNSKTKESISLNTVDQAEKISRLLAPDRWKEVHRTGDTIVFRNERALPRAWLVGDVKAVGAEEALKTITGESDNDFDPRRTALVETDVKSSPLLSQLSGGEVSPSAVAKMSSYESNRLKIETEAEHPSFLVVSEVNYPGWTARIDGAETPIYPTDYLLRGMALPAGKHTVVMEYTAPAFWKGMYVSGFTLIVLIALAAYGYVGAKLRAPSKESVIVPKTA
jgi:hypothetical protein